MLPTRFRPSALTLLLLLPPPPPFLLPLVYQLRVFAPEQCYCSKHVIYKQGPTRAQRCLYRGGELTMVGCCERSFDDILERVRWDNAAQTSR